MRVLVCGSRDWGTNGLVTNPYDYSNGPQIDIESLECQVIWTMLSGLSSKLDKLTVIEGAAPGADSAAWSWVEYYNKIEDIHGYDTRADHLHYPADWKGNGKAAGYIRNKKMLEEGKPDLVLAYTYDLSKSKGTAMMVDIAHKAGVDVMITERKL